MGKSESRDFECDNCNGSVRKKMASKLVVILALSFQASAQEGCNIDLFRSWQPVVFTSALEILYPPLSNAPTNRNISVPAGATILISCNGGRFSNTSLTTKTIPATCNQNSQLEVQDKIVDFDKIECINWSTVAAKATSTPCAPDAAIVSVGFQVGLYIQFVPQIDVCFDKRNQAPVYTHHNLTKFIGFIKSYLTTAYVTDAVYDVSLDFDSLYNFTLQRTNINKLLGLPENSTRYVNPTSCQPNPGVTTPGFCFSRRHLSYKGNFVYISQQEATFRQINVVPQWYFLDYNLDKLEYDVIDYVKKNAVDLEVYTGIYGVATLPHAVTGEAVELFLYTGEDKKAIPVPLIFWKLVYDPLEFAAIVFLTVNDPYQVDVSKNVICNDISDGITWLTWQKHNVTKGYSYACTYEDAKTKITYLPDIIVTGSLSNDVTNGVQVH